MGELEQKVHLTQPSGKDLSTKISERTDEESVESGGHVKHQKDC